MSSRSPAIGSTSGAPVFFTPSQNALTLSRSPRSTEARRARIAGLSTTGFGGARRAASVTTFSSVMVNVPLARSFPAATSMRYAPGASATRSSLPSPGPSRAPRKGLPEGSRVVTTSDCPRGFTAIRAKSPSASDTTKDCTSPNTRRPSRTSPSFSSSSPTTVALLAAATSRSAIRDARWAYTGGLVRAMMGRRSRRALPCGTATAKGIEQRRGMPRGIDSGWLART